MLLTFLPGALLASTPESALRADMQRTLEANGLTGAVWALVTPGQVNLDAVGVRNSRSGAALTPSDKVHVGSTTKTVLATGVLRLVTEGRFTLETPVTELLPEIAFENPWEHTDPVKVRHLLDHTSGLDDVRFWQVFTLKAAPDAPLARAFDRGRGLLRVRSRPGDRFAYSNMGYTLLGMIIESATGERYERYLDEHLLKPLGMHDSTFEFVSQVGRRADPRLAMGHFEKGEPHPAVPWYVRPAGQFTTTARDMAVFAQFLMGDGRIGGEVFIDTTLLRARGRSTGTEAAQAGLSAGYGLGLQLRDRFGVIGLCHDGASVGFSAMLCMYPDVQKAFFVSVNTDDEAFDYDRINALLAGALELSAPAPFAPSKVADDIASWEGTYILAPNRFASFALLDTLFNFVHVRWNGSTLQIGSPQSKDMVLNPAGGLLFAAEGRSTPSHALLRSREGAQVLTNGLKSYERVSALRVIALWLSLVAGVLGFVVILGVGCARLMRRRLKPSDPIFIPFVATVALFAPLPLFASQPFLALGDVTAASITLALVTAMAPLAALAGLVMLIRRGPVRGAAAVLAAAMLGVLQWSIVLAAWGLWPLVLWR